MTYEIWNPPSGRTRRWVKRKHSHDMPLWARFSITALLVILAGTFFWQGIKRLRNSQGSAQNSAVAAARESPAAGSAAWQRDVGTALENAARDAGAGNVTQAEMDVDRAAAILSVARIQSQPVAADFFPLTVYDLDKVMAAKPDNGRLAEHVTLLRIDLAELRSLSETPPENLPTLASEAGKKTADPGSGQLIVGAPRSLPGNSKLDAASVGATLLDGTLMPSSSELLEPPFSRLAADGVYVEGLQIAGAAQTLDGIHWKNVTFIGTRLRYQGGETNLENVYFVRCTFGIVPTERGARLANMVALDQRSLVIQ
ncbi:MAG TPA: hypothetical protein VEU52_06060 [Candidatus Limnocylindrales bacterium]|nr:hypothetical protein [Candidatus Limnocylindrales bacterium]